MELTAQVIAAAVAGIVAPFIQEIIFGAKVSGRIAGFINVGVTFVIATLAQWVTGGFADADAVPAFSFLDPSAFFAFWIELFTPVYAISQFIYSVTTSHSKSPPATGPVQSVAEKVQEAVPALGPTPPQ